MAEKFFLPRLDVNYLRREHGRLVKDNVVPMAIAMLVTMRAPLDIPLYDRVANQFQVLTPLLSLIPLTDAA
jgi:hypothetical protein